MGLVPKLFVLVAQVVIDAVANKGIEAYFIEVAVVRELISL